MTKITFEDLPSTNTPLSASNLNTLQDNVENAINSVDSDLTTLDTKVDTNATYSTSETRIGTWIDGKPLYRIVIPTTTPSSSSVATIGSISSLNYSEIVNVYGFLYTTSQAVPLNFIYGSEQGMVYVESNNIKCRITASSYYSKTCYVIVEYTKTTD